MSFRNKHIQLTCIPLTAIFSESLVNNVVLPPQGPPVRTTSAYFLGDSILYYYSRCYTDSNIYPVRSQLQLDVKNIYLIEDTKNSVDEKSNVPLL